MKHYLRGHDLLLLTFFLVVVPFWVAATVSDATTSNTMLTSPPQELTAITYSDLWKTQEILIADQVCDATTGLPRMWGRSETNRNNAFFFLRQLVGHSSSNRAGETRSTGDGAAGETMNTGDGALSDPAGPLASFCRFLVLVANEFRRGAVSSTPILLGPPETISSAGGRAQQELLLFRSASWTLRRRDVLGFLANVFLLEVDCTKYGRRGRAEHWPEDWHPAIPRDVWDEGMCFEQLFAHRRNLSSSKSSQEGFGFIGLKLLVEVASWASGVLRQGIVMLIGGEEDVDEARKQSLVQEGGSCARNRLFALAHYFWGHFRQFFEATFKTKDVCPSTGMFFLI